MPNDPQTRPDIVRQLEPELYMILIMTRMPQQTHQLRSSEKAFQSIYLSVDS